MRPSSGKERAGNLLSRDSLLVVGEVDVGAELDVLEGAFPPPQQAERGKQRVSERRGGGGSAKMFGSRRENSPFCFCFHFLFLFVLLLSKKKQCENMTRGSKTATRQDLRPFSPTSYNRGGQTTVGGGNMRPDELEEIFSVFQE